MDAWGVDVMVAACQKGLMTPPGVAFTFHGPRAEAAGPRRRSPYWDWGPRTAPSVPYERFCGTAPTHHLYGLRCALDMILTEEGLEAVWARHAVFAQAVWAAVEAWGAGGALELNIADPALQEPCGHHHPHRPGRRRAAAAVVRGRGGRDARHRSRVPRVDPDSIFRIGHMGHLNPPMLLGTLATIEAGFQSLGIPYGAGGVAAAGAVIAAGGGAPAPVSALETGVEIV